ncbi:winged helix DNA-binding protein [Dechloromonas denitrificans]|uniref:winged helix DNA-binding protein n=1 Tax=Dechloromonas denitrificans TaxID=281362 RepID=UPI001CF91A52|nr:winged helix DNA-binding protein [Dechloromonas denitrificans]UCV03887.1 winged helix DNA-binding protein [Dechloromonas denitrificans]UCV08143.1 winged helix DNA-binding protein [Dechloromonas denitrificans]
MKDLAPQDLENWHLGQDSLEKTMANFEHTLMCLNEAFARFNWQGLATAAHDLTFSSQDNTILHIIHTLGRPKSVSDIARFLNRDDLANIQYSIRKLLKAKFIEKADDRSSRGTTYRTTASGKSVIDDYVNTRRNLVAKPASDIANIEEQLQVATRAMGVFIGLYDHAARVLTTRP